MLAARQSCFTATLRFGIKPVDERRRSLAKLLKQLNAAHCAPSISDEYFLVRLAKLQIVIADLFGCEEKLIKLFGLFDADTKKHFDDHDRILQSYSRIFCESMRHQMNDASKRLDVCKLLNMELIKHTNVYDVKLRDCIRAFVKFTKGEIHQLDFV